MDQNTNYFYIVNGTQLLNATEYFHEMQLKDDRNILVLVCVSDLVLKDLNTVLKTSSIWQTKIQLFPNWILRLNRYSICRALSTYYAKYKLTKLVNLKSDQLILGNYKNVFCKYIAKNNQHSKISVIDDGYGTLDFFNKAPHKTSRLNDRVENILKIKNFSIEPDLIFTRYFEQLKKEAVKEKITLVKNSYRYLSANAKTKTLSNEKLFIGYTIVEEDILSLDDYIKLLLKVKDKIGDFIYIPHRRETQKNLTVISSYIEVKNLGMPFELYLNNQTSFPSEIIGFFSTVLFNVSQMFSDRIKLKFVKLENLEIVHINDIEELYHEISQIAELIFSYNVKSKS